MTNPFLLILLGKPGGGKGTISKWVVKEFHFKHLSTGDLLRHEIAIQSELGRKAESFMKTGSLVPSHLLSSLLHHHIDALSNTPHSRILLDGFPRTVEQVKTLDKYKVNLVANLTVPNEEIIARLSDRWTHLQSGRVYSYSFSPPRERGKDDITGEDLVRRPDDEPETIAKRLDVHETQTKPVVDSYKEVVKHFSGSSFPDLIKRDQRSKAIYNEMVPELTAHLKLHSLIK